MNELKKYSRYATLNIINNNIKYKITLKLLKYNIELYKYWTFLKS